MSCPFSNRCLSPPTTVSSRSFKTMTLKAPLILAMFLSPISHRFSIFLEYPAYFSSFSFSLPMAPASLSLFLIPRRISCLEAFLLNGNHGTFLFRGGSGAGNPRTPWGPDMMGMGIPRFFPCGGGDGGQLIPASLNVAGTGSALPDPRGSSDLVNLF